MADCSSRIEALKGKVTGRVEREKSLRPSYGKLKPSLFAGDSRVPAYSRGNPTKPSEGYSYSKAFALAAGVADANDCREEVEVSQQLLKFTPGYKRNFAKSFMVPMSSNPMYFGDEVRSDSNGQAFLKELREKMYATAEKADADEVSWLIQKSNDPSREERRKALGTFPATAGGSLVPPPMLSGEIIDLQRYAQVFTQLGAREVGLPPQGAVRYARQTGAATGYWVGEAATITESTLTTGDLELNAKKLALLTTLTQESLMFANPSSEALARQDMAEVGALLADLAMLQGTGGTQIKGVTTYTGDSNTYLNIKSYTASTVAAPGNTFQPQDVLGMISTLPDAVRFKQLKFAMAPSLFQAIMNRRADSVTAGDGKGQFVFNQMRTNDQTIQTQLNGMPVITSGQVSTTRGTVAAPTTPSTLTYAILGYWPDWMIGRYGAMEILMNPYGTTYASGQVQLRAIQYIDAGPRTPNSFVLCDNLVQA